MTAFFIISILAVILFTAMSAGWLAKDLGRNPRLWFGVSLLIPVVPCLILLCIPEKEPALQEKDDLYDYLY
jgi:hypothetical protein